MKSTLDAELFCMNQNINMLFDYATSSNDFRKRNAYDRKMAMIYSNFLLGYELHLMEEKPSKVLANHIYVEFNDSALCYTLNVFDAEVSDVINFPKLTA